MAEIALIYLGGSAASAKSVASRTPCRYPPLRERKIYGGAMAEKFSGRSQIPDRMSMKFGSDQKAKKSIKDIQND